MIRLSLVSRIVSRTVSGTVSTTVSGTTSNGIIARRSLRTSSRILLKREPSEVVVESEKKEDESKKKEDQSKKEEDAGDERSEELMRQRGVKEKLKEKYASNPPQLMEFFETVEKWGSQEIRSGREWRVGELRKKRNSDLHRLWFILLKERNMLLTMEEAGREEKELFPSPERVDRVEESMANVEDVVKERNRAYFELEVGEGETGERPSRFRRDFVGRHSFVQCEEHFLPLWMNHEWRYMHGSVYGPHVTHFLKRLREKRVKKITRQYMRDREHVRQLIRRFPDIDLHHLQEIYPRVNVDKCKTDLQYWEERSFISPGTSKKLIDDERVDN